MTRARTSSFLIFLMTTAAVAAGCGSDTTPTGDPKACAPQVASSCYSGPQLAAGVGACSMGSMVCNAEGSGFGECSGSVLPTFQGCSTGVDTNCDGEAACSGAHRWSRGLIGQGEKYAVDVGVDSDGNIALAGEFEKTIDLGGGELTADPGPEQGDIFVGKLDAAGKHLWSKRLGGAADQALYDFASDRAGNVFLTGYSEGPVEFEGATINESFTLKLSPTGELLWVIPESGYMAVDGEGNIVLAGGFSESATIAGQVLTSVGSRDTFIAKYDPDGKPLWARSAGGAGGEYLHRVSFDGAGNIAVGGQYSGEADLGGGPLQPGTNDTNQSAFVAKYDKDGGFMWSRSFVGDYVRTRVLSSDKAGNTFFSGSVWGNVDFGGGGDVPAAGAPFLTKLGPGGETLFVKFYESMHADGTPLDTSVAGVAFDAEDNMLVLGWFGSNIDLGGGFALKSGGYAVFVAKYDAAGEIIWGMTPGGGFAFDTSAGIGADPLGNVIVNGVYNSGLDFGGGLLYGNPQTNEIFVAKLAP